MKLFVIESYQGDAWVGHYVQDGPFLVILAIAENTHGPNVRVRRVKTLVEFNILLTDGVSDCRQPNYREPEWVN